ncbi:hypothetical protein [Actinomadura rudentiformis]|uniref:Uncharacterized protein n=1 Tax=Actinomadura rudentiformis TaxID=359158 RepID=A0A6H9YKE4_9ACTN|nr:hypothetical protein [Actinomadura rudentiformis]KAB2346817.1 hypothetical protein F8566_21565 [Actinomadura rudentiformis]
MPSEIIRTGRNEYGLRQFAAALGLATWQIRLAREHGIVPEPEIDDRSWSAAQVAKSAEQTERIRSAFGEDPPIGAINAAARLAERVFLDVDRADVEILVARGELTVIGRYRTYPIYLLRDVDALDPRTVTEVVAARKGPLADSVDAKGAAAILGWPKDLFNRIAAERALATDQLGRFSLSDVRAVAADEKLTQRAHEEQRRKEQAKALRAQTQIEDALRSWLLRCMAYIDRTIEDPPDSYAAGRTLRALITARATHQVA